MTITNGYTTLVTVKTALGIPVDERDDDFYLEATIESVSRMIDNHTGRRFYAETDTRYYSPVSIDAIYTDDIISVTSLKTDDDNDGVFETTWATTDYVLMPFNAGENGRPYTWIETSGFGNHSFPLGVKRAVQLVGSIGFSTTTPKQISEGCKIQSIINYKLKDAPFGSIGGEGFNQAVTSLGLSPSVKALIDPYVRRV